MLDQLCTPNLENHFKPLLQMSAKNRKWYLYNAPSQEEVIDPEQYALVREEYYKHRVASLLRTIEEAIDQYCLDIDGPIIDGSIYDTLAKTNNRNAEIILWCNKHYPIHVVQIYAEKVYRRLHSINAEDYNDGIFERLREQLHAALDTEVFDPSKSQLKDFGLQDPPMSSRENIALFTYAFPGVYNWIHNCFNVAPLNLNGNGPKPH